MASTARLLLVPLPVVGGAYVVGLIAGLVRARPEWVWLLVPWPLLAAVLAARSGARWVLVGAVVELAAAVPLHGFTTLVRAWRLEGG